MEMAAIASGTSGSAAVSLVPSQKQLGQEDFLTLLVTQLKNQDPLKPVSNEGFIAQLAQFSQLEQSMRLVKLMEQSLDPKIGGRQFSVVSLIGRQVRFRGDGVELKDGRAVIAYDLAADAAAVRVDLRDGQGKLVRSLYPGAQAAGQQEIQWDGLDDDGDPMPEGLYHVTVTATGPDGTTVAATVSSRRTVTGLRIVDDRPMLLLGTETVRPEDVEEVY